jgi:hypothetical protein
VLASCLVLKWLLCGGDLWRIGRRSTHTNWDILSSSVIQSISWLKQTVYSFQTSYTSKPIKLMINIHCKFCLSKETDVGGTRSTSSERKFGGRARVTTVCLLDRFGTRGRLFVSFNKASFALLDQSFLLLPGPGGGGSFRLAIVVLFCRLVCSVA